MNLEYKEDEYLGQVSEEDELTLDVNRHDYLFEDDYDGFVGSVYDSEIDLGEGLFTDEDIATLDDIFGK